MTYLDDEIGKQRHKARQARHKGSPEQYALEAAKLAELRAQRVSARIGVMYVRLKAKRAAEVAIARTKKREQGD